MTPLERAANALLSLKQGHTIEWGLWHHEVQKEHLKAARVVFRAIREPSNSMIEATNGISYNDNGEFNALWIWQAMIDAALNEGLET